MKLETFFEKFDQFADAHEAVTKMRELVLELAVQGKLVEQRTEELSARECIRKANKPLVDLVPDELVETPAGWVALPLGCLIASNTGGGTPSKQNPSYWNGPIPWASVKDVQSEKYLVSTIDSISEEGLKDSSSNLIPPNRLIVVTRMGLGKLAINTIPVAINQDLRAIEPTAALDLDFAYLLFKSLKMVGSGVTVKGITVDKLHAMPVLLPPLAEQKRIVTKVDELMALCDRLEAQQQERETRHAALARASLACFADAPTPASLLFLFHPSYAIPPADLRKSILTLAVQGKLIPQDPSDEPAEELFARIESTKEKLIKQRTIKRVAVEANPNDDECESLPPSWLWTRLGNSFDVRDGTHDTPKYTGEGFPLITSKNIYSGSLLFDGANLISEKDHRQISERSRVDRGDILFAMIGSIGNPVIVDTDREFSIKNVALFKYYTAAHSEPRFLLLYLKLVAEEMKARAAGGVQSFVSLGFLRNYLFPLPPLAEQRRIVAKVEQLMALVDALETQLAASRATAANLLSALVAELTTGTRSESKSRPVFDADEYMIQLISAVLKTVETPLPVQDLNAAIALLFLQEQFLPLVEARCGREAREHFAGFAQPSQVGAVNTAQQLLCGTGTISYTTAPDGTPILHLNAAKVPPIDPVIEQDARYLAAIIDLAPSAETEKKPKKTQLQRPKETLRVS